MSKEELIGKLLATLDIEDVDFPEYSEEQLRQVVKEVWTILVEEK